MNWDQLKKGDCLWINGEKGEVKSIEKIYRDDILTSVTIETWVNTSELSASGPRIYFFRTDKNEPMKIVPDEPCEDLSRYFEVDEDVISDDGSIIVSLSEKNAEGAKKILEERKKEEERLILEAHISTLEEEIENKKEEVIKLREEISRLARPEN